ncbi:NUDIX domain-containing protein [Marichromatium gracile]|uniref:NUDIX hydrolase n=1 Tax=Marichromatium gracile TaxID=1048 RepID=A0ABR5VLV3_MARGR|nr:NUDIX hydrolase [Marichromatium gracile]KXX65402.1 NUDIX hydrolase [Marichromatium gracile]
MPAPVTPLLTVDVIIELVDRPERPIVLIERRNPPHGWAIPGGFVDPGERVERAAVREALEETALQVELHALLGVYSSPLRDPRAHTASAVYIATASGEPEARDDAKGVELFNPDMLPERLAFDHAEILTDYRRFRLVGTLPPPRLG